jgi:hypothetical protein
VRQRVRRPVVGDGRGHQHDVRLPVRERGLEHRLGRRRLQHFDAAGRRDRKVGGEQRHLGAALPRLFGQRDPHASR